MLSVVRSSIVVGFITMWFLVYLSSQPLVGACFWFASRVKASFDSG